MANFVMTEWIDVKVKSLFEFLSNVANAAQYIDNIKSGEKLTEGAIGVGTRFSETRIMNGKEATTELEVREYEPYSRFAIGSESEGIDVNYVYTLSAEKGGTRIMLNAEIAASGLKKMMLPMVAGILKKEDAEHLKKVKAVLENEKSSK